MDNPRSNDFNVKTFLHSSKLPTTISTNHVNELSDLFIVKHLSQFGPKGDLRTYVRISNKLMYYNLKTQGLCE